MRDGVEEVGAVRKEGRKEGRGQVQEEIRREEGGNKILWQFSI